MAQASLMLAGLLGAAAAGQEAIPENKPVSIQAETPLHAAWRRALASGVNDLPACRVGAPVSPSSQLPIIVLDLGHGFTPKPDDVELGTSTAPRPGLKDHGTVGRRAHLWETDIVDELGAALRDELAARGYEVQLTREPGRVFTGSANRFTTLASRGYFAAYLSEETGREVFLLSLHVDPVTPGGMVYFQNSRYGVAGSQSQDFAQVMAGSYRLGGHEAAVNRTRTFNNRMLHSFALAESACPDVNGRSVLLEMGDINNAMNVASFRAMMARPAVLAAQMADGIDRSSGNAKPPNTVTLASISAMPHAGEIAAAAHHHAHHRSRPRRGRAV